MNIFEYFKLSNEKENFQKVSENIKKGIDFKGTNLWIHVFAIFIASLGLNVNSTAVVIGAMLVSPLMGPIMGIGFGMAINDIKLLKNSFYAYLLTAVIGLITSTIYFYLSPLNEAHSEILARIEPNIYDVLIALFGGLAGILATSSKLKGNVIPGVAIATALIPPLCTAGYGLATLQFKFFFGAFYLFLINTVFIALATLITVRFLNYPYKSLPRKEDETKAKRIAWVIVLITLLPSFYFGYTMIQQNRFIQSANKFIENEAIFPNDYLLKKNIDSKNKKITLIFGGAPIAQKDILTLKSKLKNYNIKDAKLDVKQGFAYLQEELKEIDEKPNQLSLVLNDKEKELIKLQMKLDSINKQKILSKQIFNELKVQHNQITSFSLQQSIIYTDSTQNNSWIALIKSELPIEKENKLKIGEWLKVRINTKKIKIKFE